MIKVHPEATAGAALTLAGNDGPDFFAQVVGDETSWRLRPIGLVDGASAQKIIATRWHSLSQDTREVEAETSAGNCLVAIVLRNEDVRFSLSGRTIHDGAVTAGMMHVTEPAVSAHCIFRGPYDVLHLHVPNGLIAEIGRDVSGCNTAVLHSESVLFPDPLVERLGRALLAAEAAGPLGQLYVDCVSTAVVARLLARTPQRRSAHPRVAQLARWRLRRVTEYVEASLAESVSLADLASAAGLTRMHFAAQFRAATGLPPHEYLIRRRIERAQELLINSEASVVDVALSVGFQTQAHFTTVFKRFAGQPPHAWRLSQSPIICHQMTNPGTQDGVAV